MKSPLSVLPLLGAVLLLSSCQTVRADLPPEASPEQYFQRAQEAFDRSDFETSALIYRRFLATLPSDPAYVVAAEYELAFLAYKMDQRDEAIQGLQSLLAKYADSSLAPLLPAWPRVLATRLLRDWGVSQ